MRVKFFFIAYKNRVFFFNETVMKLMNDKISIFFYSFLLIVIRFLYFYRSFSHFPYNIGTMSSYKSPRAVDSMQSVAGLTIERSGGKC